MAIAFTLNNNNYRLMFKYGWFMTDHDYRPKDVRGMLRDWMATSIINANTAKPGDLVFSDPKGNSGKQSKFAWRMCSVFINKISTRVVDNEVIVDNQIVVGPFTSVCVPGDRFSYNEARYHALATLKESALRMYAKTEQGVELPSLFHITMQGFVAYGKRPRNRKG